MGSKVTIIGGGHVGTSAAFAMLLRETAREIVLLDRDKNKMMGEQLDFQHSLAFLATTKIVAAQSYEDTKDSDVIIFTSGVAQVSGQSRLDLLKSNAEILEATLPGVVKLSPESVVIIVSNPVDALTYKASRLLNLPKGRVFGTGTSLDSARFRFYLSELLSINPKNIHAYVLGEHGDSSFPVISTADVGGQSLINMKGISKEQIQECFIKTRDAAKTIIATKGATYYAIGVVISQLTHAVLEDAKRIFPVSIPLDGEYGQKGVSLSVPCELGRKGMEKILEIPLSDEEKRLMENSANILKKFIN
ncbi:MAG: L-lactate dehydrogenase [Candidatus Levybacteria bacterium CG_4_10_14_0_2_um_filter_35_8]|nr:MAG: L-lactate dehydrogenase [Candidatus Levybacteria bacterium CG_4_10_14_0_8_um_filter_35_23]PJA00738.1 MAG: L-lactate dehydrogenase [Candidatus Levybacteria bacterium CG_4_10_14_0_2_um_filter_35_8]